MGKLPTVPAQTALADADLFYFVDVDDTTDDATGTSQQVTVGDTRLAMSNYPALTYATAADTLALVDNFSLIYYSNAALVTVTIPTNASVAFPVGSRMLLLSTGAGGLTLTTTSLTLLGSSPPKTIAQNEAIGIEKVATDTWAILGGTAA